MGNMRCGHSLGLSAVSQLSCPHCLREARHRSSNPLCSPHLPTVNSETKTTIRAKMMQAPIWGEVLLTPQKVDKARDRVLQNLRVYLYLPLWRDWNQNSWMVYCVQDKGETGFWLADSCLLISISQGLTWLDSATNSQDWPWSHRPASTVYCGAWTHNQGFTQAKEALWGPSCIPRPWLLIKEKQWCTAWDSVVECKKERINK